MIKLIWPCISGDLSIVDSFNEPRYFLFLTDISDFVGCELFCQNLYFSQYFCLFCVIPMYFFFQKQCFSWFSVITQLALLTLVFTRCYFEHRGFLMCSPTITRTHEETKTRRSTRDILSSVSPVQVRCKWTI